MRTYLKDIEIKAFRNTTRTFSKSVNDSLLEFKAEQRQNQITVFLSHKHDEREELDGAISFLKSHGVSVYVDWLDEGMPRFTSGATAQRIKQKIKDSDKFILLATEAAIASKWCNWELGLGDAAKYIKHIAILPIRKGNDDFSGAEYIQIYPSVENQNGFSKYTNGSLIEKGYYLRYPNVDGPDTIVKMSDWLSRK